MDFQESLKFARQIEVCYLGCGQRSYYAHQHDVFDATGKKIGSKKVGQPALGTHQGFYPKPGQTEKAASNYTPFWNLLSVWRARAQANLTNPSAKKKLRRGARQQLKLAGELSQLLAQVDPR